MPALDVPLHALSIAQAGELLRTRALTPLQLVQACLARTEAQEPQLHAFITRSTDAALAQAEQATREIAANVNQVAQQNAAITESMKNVGTVAAEASASGHSVRSTAEALEQISTALNSQVDTFLAQMRRDAA